MQGLRPGTSPPPVSTPMRVIGQASREECRSSVGFGARARSPGRGAHAAGASAGLAPIAWTTWYWPGWAGGEVRGMSGQVGGDAVDVDGAGRSVDDVVAAGPRDEAGARQQLEGPQPREGVAAGGVAGASHLLDVGTLPAVAGDAREVHDRSLSVMALGVSGRTRTSGGACIAQHYRVPRVSVIFARIRSLLP